MIYTVVKTAGWEEFMKIYVDQNTRLEDMKSTAWSFSIVGIAGIVFLILLWMGMLPIQIVQDTKIILTVVMGILFAFFLFVGIHAFASLNRLKASASNEKNTYDTIVSWFMDSYAEALQKKKFDETESEDINSGELLYFPRYQEISTIIASEYPDLSEEFLDHIVEDLYAKIFPEN